MEISGLDDDCLCTIFGFVSLKDLAAISKSCSRFAVCAEEALIHGPPLSLSVISSCATHAMGILPHIGGTLHSGSTPPYNGGCLLLLNGTPAAHPEHLKDFPFLDLVQTLQLNEPFCWAGHADMNVEAVRSVVVKLNSVQHMELMLNIPHHYAGDADKTVQQSIELFQDICAPLFPQLVSFGVDRRAEENNPLDILNASPDCHVIAASFNLIGQQFRSLDVTCCVFLSIFELAPNSNPKFESFLGLTELRLVNHRLVPVCCQKILTLVAKSCAISLTSFAYCCNSTNNGAASGGGWAHECINDFTPLQRLTMLRCLELDLGTDLNCGGVSPKCFPRPLCSVTQYKVTVLGHITTGSESMRLLYICPYIQRLDLSYSYHMDDTAIVWLGELLLKHFQSLACLKLQFNSCSTDAYIALLCSLVQMPKLNSVSLSGLSLARVFRRSISTEMSNSSNELLNNVGEATKRLADSFALCKYLKHLKLVLDIQKAEEFTSTLTQFCIGLRKGSLETLNVHTCHRMVVPISSLLNIELAFNTDDAFKVFDVVPKAHALDRLASVSVAGTKELPNDTKEWFHLHITDGCFA